MRPFVTWHNTTTECGSGSWAVIDGVLIVRTAYGTNSAQLEGMTPESLAQILIRELAGDPPCTGAA